MNDLPSLAALFEPAKTGEEIVSISLVHRSARSQWSERFDQLNIPFSLLDDLRTLGKHALEIACADMAVRGGVHRPSDLALATTKLVHLSRQAVAAHIRDHNLAKLGSGITASEKASDGIWQDLSYQLIGSVAYCRGLQAVIAIAGATQSHASDVKQLVGKDPKTILQEILQAGGKKPPTYAVISEQGPAHALEFTVRVATPDGKAATGAGGSKKLASAAAAAAYLTRYFPKRTPEFKVQRQTHTTGDSLKWPSLGSDIPLALVQDLLDEYGSGINEAGLFVLALTHRSYKSLVTRESPFEADNGLLAAIGARAFIWAVTDIACRMTSCGGHGSTSHLSSLVAHAMSAADLCSLRQTVDLRKNLLLGPGERSNQHQALILGKL